MRGAFKAADDLLRGRGLRDTSPPGLVPLLALLAACGMAYGAVMGSSSGVSGERLWRVVFSAVKVPLLLAATMALSLPSFFVLSTLLGLRGDFAESLRAVVESQAGLALVLVSLAPLTAFWYASTVDYRPAILFNAAAFAAASLGAQLILRRAYRPLIARDPRHRWMIRAWGVVYAFVGIQMGWMLRPFIGDPAKPVAFFRGGELENAYVVVARMAWEVLVR